MKKIIYLSLFIFFTSCDNQNYTTVELKDSFQNDFVQAALNRTKQNITYNGSYFIIDYPNGDIPSNYGVCTDVVIRAYREVGIDLQKLIHEDIKKSGKEIQLSAAVKPNLVIARERWFQNWQYWLENDIVDFVVPMNYFPEIKDFNMSVQIMKNNLVN